MQGSQAQGFAFAHSPPALNASVPGRMTPAAVDNTPPELLAALNSLALVSAKAPGGGNSQSLPKLASKSGMASALQPRGDGRAESKLEGDDDDSAWNTFDAVNARLDLVSETSDENLGAVRDELIEYITATSDACYMLFSKVQWDQATVAHPETVRQLCEIMHPVVAGGVRDMVTECFKEKRSALLGAVSSLNESRTAMESEIMSLKSRLCSVESFDLHKNALGIELENMIDTAVDEQLGEARDRLEKCGSELRAKMGQLKQGCTEVMASAKQMVANATQDQRTALNTEMQAFGQAREELVKNAKQMVTGAIEDGRTELQTELRALKQECVAVGAELQALKQSRATLDGDQHRAELETSVKQLVAAAIQDERAAFGAELQALKQERNELETNAKQMIASATQNERAALNAELQALKQERKELAASVKQLVAAAIQGERAAFGAELQALKQERRALETNTKQMIASATQNERAALNAELQALKQERKELAASPQQVINGTTQGERTAFIAEVQALKQKLETVGAELQVLKQSRATLGGEQHRAELETSVKQIVAAAVQDERTALGAELQALKQSCAALGGEQHHAETKTVLQEHVAGLEGRVQQMIATAVQTDHSALVKEFAKELAQVKEQLIVHMRHSLAASKQPKATAGASVDVLKQLDEMRAAQTSIAEGLAAVRKGSTDDAESMRQLVEHRTTLFQMYETLKQHHVALFDANDKIQDIHSWRLSMEGLVEKLVLHLQGHLPSRDAVLEQHNTMLAELRTEAAKFHEKHQQADEERARTAKAREQTAAATRVQADLEQKVSEHTIARTKLEQQVANIRETHAKEQAGLNQRLDSVHRKLAEAADLRMGQAEAQSDLERRVKSAHRELAEGQAKVHADLKRRVESVYHELDKTTRTTRSCLGKRLDAQRDEQNRQWKFLEPAVKKHRKVLRTHRMALRELRSSASEHYRTLMRVAGNAAPSTLNSLLKPGGPTRGTPSPQEDQMQSHCS